MTLKSRSKQITRPRVIVEVSGGTAGATWTKRGTGDPDIYIMDWDSLDDTGPEGCTPPPAWAWRVLQQKYKRYPDELAKMKMAFGIN